MSTIIFHNPGQLDIRGATTMGLSAKADDSAIGKFGTGLKYAIASILRWGGAIEIETAGRKYQFRTRTIDFRGKEHSQIEMLTWSDHDNAPTITELGYTTHYGSHWEAWQVFRELYSNARDEAGGVTNNPDYGYVSLFETVIRVDCREISEAYIERDLILLPRKGTPVPGCDYETHISKIPSNFLYYRGVRVSAQKCLFTWDLYKHIELTEDRSLKDHWAYMNAMGQIIQASTDTDLITKCLCAPEGYFERKASYCTWNNCSDEFITVLEHLWKRNPDKIKGNLLQILKKHRSYVGAPEEVVLTKLQQSMLDKAKSWVERMGHTCNMPIRVVAFNKGTLGQSKNGEVLLSPELFRQGTKQLVSTLLEEVIHHETGLLDGYELQTYLFNRLVGMYEEQFGEAI